MQRYISLYTNMHNKGKGKSGSVGVMVSVILIIIAPTHFVTSGISFHTAFAYPVVKKGTY